MDRVTRTITLTWRDEDLGKVSGAVAFRDEIIPFPSDTARKKIARTYRSHGFAADYDRAAWIAPRKAEDMPLRLADDLEAMGFEVIHKGNVPDCIAADPTPKP